MRVCKECEGGKPIHYKAGKSVGVCLECHREKSRKEVADRRRKKKLQMLANNDESTGWKVCSKCLTNKRLSEYSPRGNSRSKEKLNKICDSCLTKIYELRASDGFDDKYWRQKAYNCNTAGRQALAKSRGVKVSSIKLKDLEYVCKPQDLAKMFSEQGGRCYYCGDLLAPSNTSVDHATPLDRGGAHALSNFRIVCWDCNHLKFTKTEEEFWSFLRKFIPRFTAILQGRVS